MIPEFLLKKEQHNIAKAAEKYKMSFIDKTMKNMASFVSVTMNHWHYSQKKGLLQSVDPRIKVLFLIFLIVIINFTHIILPQLIISILIILLFIISGLNVFNAYKKILLIGFFFGFLIFVPASLNIFSKGDPLIVLLRLSKSHHWWIYTIPNEISITHQGISTLMQLTLKVINSVSVVFLIVSSTGIEKLIKALSYLKVPGIFLLTITMSYKLIFVLAQTVEESYQALKMRWWGKNATNKAEAVVTGRIAYIFRKSWERYELVYQAMISRGFNGSINFSYNSRLKQKDYYFIGFSLLFFLSIIYLNTHYVRSI